MAVADGASPLSSSSVYFLFPQGSIGCSSLLGSNDGHGWKHLKTSNSLDNHPLLNINLEKNTYLVFSSCHSSEIKYMRSTKCSNKTLQNLLYFVYN